MSGGTISAERRRQGQIELQRIKDALADRIGELARELLRGGRESACRHYWEASNVACSGKGWSLRVNLDGGEQGLWYDFGAGAGGSALDLIAETRCNGDIAAAIREAKLWLEGRGWSADPVVSAREEAEAAERRAAREAEADAKREKKRKGASALWHGAAPFVGSPAQAYLSGRGIDFATLGRTPGSLRFRPDAWCEEAAQRDGRANAKLPAMIACIMGLDGVLRGVHRWYLDLSGWDFRTRSGIVTKARLEKAKVSLAPYRGGHIPIWKGAQRAPLRAIAAGTPVYAGESPEDCWSVAMAKRDARIVSAVSLSNLAALELPPQMGPLVLIGQNDPPGSPASGQFEAVIAAHQAAGREVRCMFPPAGFKDFNDVLMGKRI